MAFKKDTVNNNKANWRKHLQSFAEEPLFKVDQSAQAYCQKYREANLQHNTAFRDAIVTVFTKISGPV